MKKWLTDFEVISEVCLSKGNDAELIFEAPDGSYTAQIRNLKIKPGTIEPLIGIQIIVEDESWETAYEKAQDYLLKLLDCMALTLNTTLKRKKNRRVIEWTPGVIMREQILFQEFGNHDIPYPVLDREHLKTFSLFFECDKDESLALAMRWYRRALMADMPEEAFQYFWFALEILAEREKPAALVPDKCAKCREPLFCPKCQKISDHKPYPKQAIEALIKNTVRGTPEQLFDTVQSVRHALLHGEPTYKIEEDLKIEFGKIKDHLGKVVWTALFNQLKKNIKPSREGERFALLQTNTFGSHQPGIAAHLKVPGRGGCDHNNPKIEDFTYPPITVKMIVKESSEAKEETEHTPIE